MKETFIHNAKAYLERGAFAEAVLVRGETIAAAGTNREISAMASPGAEKINAGGNLLLPGFNDSHLHLYAYGRNLYRIQGNGVTSIDELVERGRELIERLNPPEGSVVSGTGWNQEKFSGDKRLPNRHDLDRISAVHAIILNRVCGHSLSCNSLAMEMAGITRNLQRAGGELFETDKNGEPLGIFGEGPAMNRLRALIPPFSQEQIEEQLFKAMKFALKNGLTSLGTRDVVEENYQSMAGAYIKMFTDYGIHLRVSLQCTIEKDEIFNEFIKRGWVTGASMGHPYLTMGGSKLFADGSLGAHTAYMRKPYFDDPASCGFQIHSQEEMDALVKKHHDSGFQVIVHAIGDAAIEEVLNSFEKATGGTTNPLRHGIVHCQICDMEIMRRMARNGILAFVQPIFLTSDLYIAESRVGKELASTSYAFNTMEKLGIRAVYGTDCPIESMSPLDCIDCAVNRHDILSGYPENGFFPSECVDVSTAVDAYTAGSAYAEFAEDKKGRIKPGQLADMVLLDRDIFTIPKKEIRKSGVLWTMVGGNMAYKKG